MNLTRVLNQLKAERSRLWREMERVDEALASPSLTRVGAGRIVRYPTQTKRLLDIQMLWSNIYVITISLTTQGHEPVPADNPNPTRDWREIAAEASKERDSQKLLELTKELEQALDERDKQLQLKREPNSSDGRRSDDIGTDTMSGNPHSRGASR